MTNAELTKRITEAYETHKGDYEYIGLRFEDREYTINDVCDCSRDNSERSDEREFPEYGTDEYNNLPMLDGACAWQVTGDSYFVNSYQSRYRTDTDKLNVFAEHCYIVSGNYATRGTDDNEIIIRDAVVLDIMF